MRRAAIAASGVALAAACAVALGSARGATFRHAGQSATAATVVNRMNSAYRSIQTYYDVAKVETTRPSESGAKQGSGSLTIALARPNRYLLELKADNLNTVIVSDGTTLTALRPDRKAYTRSRAPALIMKSDPIGKVDMPSLGARIITQFLAANGREGEIGGLLLGASVAGPRGFGDKLAYVLSFPYHDAEATVYVGSDDFLVRQVRLTMNGVVVWSERHDDIRTDKPIPASTFERALPDGAVMVVDLPPLPQPGETASADAGADSGASASTADTAGSLRGRALAIFRANGCGRCHSGSAPDLSHEGASRDAAWIAEHIRDPQSQSPGSRMPAYAGRMSDSDITALSNYLASLK